MAAFLSSPGPTGRDDYSHLLSSPAQQPWSLLSSPAPAVQEGRLSFDVLTSPGAVHDAGFKVRSTSHLGLFSLPERPKLADAAPAPDTGAQQQQGLQAALTQKVVAKVVEAKQQEVGEMVAGMAAKYGLAADYAKAEETIKAVWAEQSTHMTLASSAADAAPAAAKASATAAMEPTLGKDSSDHTTSCDEEAGQQATSTLKAVGQGVPSDTGNMLKRPLLPAQPSFTFPAQAQPGTTATGAGNDASLKRRRVQYDRMRELEAQVQRVRHLGDALSQSLRQAEAQHAAATLENEQLWNALLHIHASLRAAHAAQLRQQVAMHAAAVAAALPPPVPVPEAGPSPNTLFGGLFSPDAEELAAACGMFISPAKPVTTAAATNKPRKLFMEETSRPDPLPPLGELPAELSPAVWVQAA